MVAKEGKRTRLNRVHEIFRELSEAGTDGFIDTECDSDNLHMTVCILTYIYAALLDINSNLNDLCDAHIPY